MTRVLPALLAVAALAADAGGSHGAALALALAAIPAGFAYTLDCYGDALEARCTGLRPLVAGVALVCLVFSAALRSPAVVGGVPQLALSTLVIALLLYAALGLAAVLQVGRPVPESV
jgi:hypothetical protein